MIAHLVRRADLTHSDREAMFRLLAEHFEGVEPRTFDRDLDEKNWVLLFTDPGALKGFSTLLAYDTQHRGERISVVYSGDTIMHPDGWSTSALPRSWIAAVRALRESSLGGTRLYWLLLTSGFRTYRLLPVFWREFYPRHDAATPATVDELLSALALERLGSRYDGARGIVRFPTPQVLTAPLQDVPAGRLADPHVTFFLERNPGWSRGDELVCLTEIAFENLTPAGRRMWLHTAGDMFRRERAG